MRDQERTSAKQQAHLKHRYGISLDEFNRMLADQEGRCAVCVEQRKLCVDHDHETGRVRGLLCRRCNLAMQALDTNLARALAYLDGSHGL